METFNNRNLFKASNFTCRFDCRPGKNVKKMIHHQNINKIHASHTYFKNNVPIIKCQVNFVDNSIIVKSTKN